MALFTIYIIFFSLVFSYHVRQRLLWPFTFFKDKITRHDISNADTLILPLTLHSQVSQLFTFSFLKVHLTQTIYFTLQHILNRWPSVLSHTTCTNTINYPSLFAQTTSILCRSTFISLTLLTNIHSVAVYRSASNLRQPTVSNVTVRICNSNWPERYK